MKKFRQFLREQESRDEKVRAIRNLVLGLIKAGVLDDLLEKQFLDSPLTMASTRKLRG